MVRRPILSFIGQSSNIGRGCRPRPILTAKFLNFQIGQVKKKKKLYTHRMGISGACTKSPPYSK